MKKFIAKHLVGQPDIGDGDRKEGRQESVPGSFGLASLLRRLKRGAERA